MQPVRLYGAAQVAKALGVTKSAVSNWLTRHADTVPEAFAVVDNHRFGDTFLWDDEGICAWAEWFHNAPLDEEQ